MESEVLQKGPVKGKILIQIGMKMGVRGRDLEKQPADNVSYLRGQKEKYASLDLTQPTSGSGWQRAY